MTAAMQARQSARSRDGKYAEMHLAEGDLAAVEITVLYADSCATGEARIVPIEPEGSPAGSSAIGAAWMARRDFHVHGKQVTVERHMWVEATTGGTPFGAEEHSNAVAEENDADALHAERLPAVDGIDYSLMGATRTVIDGQEHSVDYDTSTRGTASPADGQDAIMAELAEIDWEDHFDPIDHLDDAVLERDMGASLRRGIEQAGRGEAIEAGSFAGTIHYTPYDWNQPIIQEAHERFNAWADEFDDETGLLPAEPPIVQEHTFTEFGEFTPIAGDGDERGIVGILRVRDNPGNEIEVTHQLAVSRDDQGRWWNIYRAEQAVTTRDRKRMVRELGAGNIDNRTWASEAEAWAALQDARRALTYDHQYETRGFEVLGPDWYEELDR